MRLRLWLTLLTLVSLPFPLLAQTAELSKTVKEFVRVGTPKVVLTHVRVIDGTGAPGAEHSRPRCTHGMRSASRRSRVPPHAVHGRADWYFLTRNRLPTS